jgi:hypothetical protein
MLSKGSNSFQTCTVLCEAPTRSDVAAYAPTEKLFPHDGQQCWVDKCGQILVGGQWWVDSTR